MRRVLFFLSVLWLASACKDNITTEVEPITDANPYDNLDYNDSIVPPIPVDSNTFVGIHKYILAVKCGVPACHDGTFEPDYRTVQSAYQTLVYAPVFKNSPDSAFTHRVVPFDTAMSWLHERITTNDAILGKMPLYDTLPPQQIELITNWILDGAKDPFGNTPNLPNPQPSFFGVYAELVSNGMRVDTMRGDFIFNPFMVPQNEIVDIWFGVYDDATWTPLMGAKKIRFSTNPLEFNGPDYNLITEFTPQSYPTLYSGPVPYWHLHYEVNTAQWNPGDVVYMRIYVQDADHSTPTEIPTNSSPFYFQTYHAFTVQ